MRKFSFFVILIWFFSVEFACAQMTIINVPSGEVTPEKRIFLEHESQFRPEKEGRFWNGTNYLAVGVGHNTELTATYFNLGNFSYNNDTMALGFKSAVPLAIDEIKQYQPKIVFGSALAVPLQNNGFGHWIYSAANFTIPQTNTRFTAGISQGTKQIFDRNTTAAMFGFEQKITEKLSYIGDWYSGRSNPLGIFASALSYNFPQDVVLIGGYQVANTKRIARNGFVVEVAKTF